MSKINSKYYAYQLSLKHPQRELGVDRLGVSLLNATIDMNPHQIDGALFYFDNPLSKGVILADEVGLGKTIEAGIVLCQLWSEMKRKIILIVPATLRKQWANELQEKFHLPAVIIDGPVYRSMKNEGIENPFDQNGIVICSYDMGGKKNTDDRPYGSDIESINRDVVVFDEAHKLRNVYRDLSSDLDDIINPSQAYDEDGNRKESIAKRLYDRFFETPKILLTATPLQNSLLELFGMMSFVDPYAFGDLDSFKEQYISASLQPETLLELRDRIQPFFHRTLRRQVADQIKYTKRIPYTIEYDWSEDEEDFYEQMSDFLRTSPLFQSKNGRVNYLVVLVYWKLLASSVPAILGTMRKLLGRLESEKKEILANRRKKAQSGMDTEILENDDIVTTYQQEAEDIHIELTQGISNTLDEVTLQEIEEYISQVKRLIHMGETVSQDNKAQALIKAIDVAYTELQKLGGKKKVLIFTESRRTQDYLFSYLQNNGFENKIVCFNGDNNSPQVREIYNNRKAKYEHTRRFSGSKSSDIRASIVDYFKEEAEIMIATESASEGVNLQFCSLLINYDLPWNPQRVEQRIGRCHRYGQEFDVLVMNLINTSNRADQRVYELLNSKLDLFQGLFGASDKVLGVLESGVDIEKKIFDIYQTCRTKEEIDKAFDELQLENHEEVEAKLAEAKEKIFNRFDEDVARRLKDKKEKSELMLSELQTSLIHLIDIELGDDAQIIDNGTIKIDGSYKTFPPGIYSFDNSSDGYLLRSNDQLGHFVIKQAKEHKIEPIEVTFDLTNHPSKISMLESLIGTTGWLSVSCLTIHAYNDEEYLVHACIDEEGNIIEEEQAKKLLRIIATDLGNVTFPDEINVKLTQRTQEIVGLIKEHSDMQNEKHFDIEMDKLDNRAEDLKKSLEKQQKKLKNEIRQLKKDARGSTSNLQEKISLQRTIKKKEKRLSHLRRELHELEDKIDEKKEGLIDEIEKRLESRISLERMFTIHRTLI